MMTILDAIERGDIDRVRTLIEEGFDPDTPIGADGDLALCWAAAFGQLPIVFLLLDAGAAIDASPAHGMGGPALSDAIFENHLETARALVDRGASVDYPSAAALGMMRRVKSHNEDHSERWSAFLSACKTGQTCVIEYLVPRGIDLSIYPPGNEWGGIGASGLHWAASGGHHDLVRTLVGMGAPVDSVDDTFENTPLGWVLLDEDYEMADLLIDLGADPALAKN